MSGGWGRGGWGGGALYSRIGFIFEFGVLTPCTLVLFEFFTIVFVVGDPSRISANCSSIFCFFFFFVSCNFFAYFTRAQHNFV